MPDRESLHVESDRIILRPLSVNDVGQHYVDWLNDSETMRYLEYPCGNATIDEVVGYVSRYDRSESALLLGVFSKKDAKHIGNIKLDPVSWTNRKAVMGILIGEPSARGRGIGREAVRLALDICFGPMKLNRVELGVTEDNLPAIKCYDSIGFVREGVLRKATRRGDGYLDNYYYGILASDFASVL